MKIYIILLLTILPCSYIMGQTQDSIIYIVPDSVEIVLAKQIKTRKVYKPDSNIGFYLTGNADNTYSIYLMEYQNSDYIFMNSKRYVLVDLTKFPLMLDYDIVFATYDKMKVGVLGNRFDGLIPFNRIIIEGNFISFDRFGQDVKEELGIYKKE